MREQMFDAVSDGNVTSEPLTFESLRKTAEAMKR